MSCLLRRNAEGNITEVLTPTGDKSLLFDEIHGNIFMADAETSAKITSLAYSSQIQKQFPNGSVNTYSTGEPKVFYQTDDAVVYNDVEDLLIDGKQGNVKAGFVNPKTNQFIPVVSFSTNEGPVSQFMSEQVLEGVLSTKRVLGEDGITRLQGKGIYDDTKAATASLFASNAKMKMGYGNVTYNKENGLIELNAPSDLIPVELKNGSYSYMTMEEALNSEDVADKPLLIVQNELRKRPFTRVTQPNKVRRSDAEIVTALQNFLSSLGFSMTTLDNYRKRYNTVYGKDPDIQAMADISNRIVAFQQGQLTLENLSEEVAHIAIEAYSDQGSIVSALAVAHLTPEYAQYADYYRTKYAQFYEGVALEDQVRKEILGKVLAKEFLTNFRAENRETEGIGLVAKLREIWDAFINYISGGTRPYHLSILRELNKDIIDSIASKNFQKFQNDLSNNKNFFYSAMSAEHQKLQQNLVEAKKAIESSAKAEQVRNIDRAVLERIDDDLSELNMISSANTIVGIIERKVEELSDELKAVEGKTGIDSIVAGRAVAIGEILKNNLIPIGTAIEESLKKMRDESSITDPRAKKVLDSTVQAISKTMRESSEKFRGLEDKMKRNLDAIGDTIIDQKISEGVISTADEIEIRSKIRTAVGNELKDSGKLFAYFGMISDSSNPILALIGKIAVQMATNVRIEFNAKAGKLVDKVLKGGMLKYQSAIIDRDENGKPTHYIWGPLRYAAEEKAMFDETVRLTTLLSGRKKEDAKEVEKLLKGGKKPASIINESISVRGVVEGKSEATIREEQEQAIEKFNEGMQSYQMDNHAKPMNKQYYDEQKDKFDRLQISLISKETIKIFNLRSNEVIGHKRNKDGSVDKTKLSLQEVEQLNRIKKEREMERNPYDSFQEIKEGLRIIPAGKLTEEDIKEIEANFKFRIPSDYKGDIVTLQKGLTIDQLSDKSRLSLDLNNLSYDYQFNNSVSTKVSDSFYNTIVEMRKEIAKGNMTEQQLFEWVTTNGTVSFSDEYYESLGDASRASELLNKLLTEGLTPAEEVEYANLEGKVVTYASQVEAYIKTVDDDTKKLRLENLFQEYQDLNRKRKYLLKENKRAGSALDVNVHAMDIKVRDKILQIEGRAAAIRNEIKLPERFRKQLSTDVSFELNDDFMKMATERGLAGEGDIFTFALDHMTHANKRATEDFAIQIEKLLKGSTTSIDSRYEKFFESLDEKGLINESMPIDRVIAISKDEFAKTKVASYFKKYQPATFRKAMDALKNGDIPIEDFIRWTEAKAMGNQEVVDELQEKIDSIDGLNLIKITPDFSWQQDVTAGRTNGSYKRGLYYKQLNEKWLDDTWFEFYGIKKEAYLELEDDDISQLIPTKNKEQFVFLVEFMKQKEEILDLLGDKTSTNKWLRPQIKKSGQESLLSIGAAGTKIASVKDTIANIFQKQVDEQEYGSTGSIVTNDKTITTRFVPKYFQTRLEDPAVISEASFSAVLLELKEAIAYKEKTKSIKEVRALMHKLENQNFIESGSSKKGNLKIKKGAVTNQHKMATEFINWKFYGVQQSRELHFSMFGMEFDGTRILSAIQRFSNFSNLGFNWAADMTGATTGILNNLMDRVSGEYFHNSSLNKANGTAIAWVKDYSIEMESLKKDSKLGKTYELFGITDAAQSLRDSNVSSVLRFANLKNSGYFMSRLSNLTLGPKITISALYDYRFYNGKFISFQNFVKQVENEANAEGGSITAKDSKEIENRWNNLQDKMLMDYIDFSQTYATYNQKFRDLYGSQEEADAAFKSTVSRVSAKVQKAIMNVDGVLNDTDRIAAQRDVMTNMLMQHKGWIPILFARKFKRGAYNFSNEKFEEGSYRTVFKYLRGAIKDRKLEWNGLEDYQKRNIIRVNTEFAFAFAALMLGSLVLDSDDDDDTLFENIFQLIYLRTTSEIVSSTVFGMAGVVKETYEDPIPSMNLYMLAEPFSAYKGLSTEDEDYGNKFFKRVVKASPLKIKNRFEDVQTMIDNFRFYNDPTLLNLGKFSENQAKKAERTGIEGVIRN